MFNTDGVLRSDRPFEICRASGQRGARGTLLRMLMTRLARFKRLTRPVSISSRQSDSGRLDALKRQLNILLFQSPDFLIHRKLGVFRPFKTKADPEVYAEEQRDGSH